ncbi:Hypothetical protein Minf_1505 [Methylacidiphilum infernorum V4]|uniref:Uncharacterized protein n=1 Tax=Methylacidiphilum infernorum (isolate V4) TaxID=481448 RepID=B3DW56_METI4|nr:Hypothetical protein Minf_1505 [Methylacidiphilum infernorum V4]
MLNKKILAKDYYRKIGKRYLNLTPSRLYRNGGSRFYPLKRLYCKNKALLLTGSAHSADFS